MNPLNCTLTSNPRYKTLLHRFHLMNRPRQSTRKDLNVRHSILGRDMTLNTYSTLVGLPSILELLRVLINVLDPNDQQHTDSTRLIALGILNAAFEEAGPRIADFPSLEALVLDPGCKFLFQLARSENSHVLHSALRTISTVFETMRKHLKLQQELFLAFTIDRLAPPMPPKGSNKKGYSGSPRPGTPLTPSLGSSPGDHDSNSEKGTSTPPRVLVAPARGETRDLILETLSQISRHPSFMVDLYINYDCDINCENLFERLIDFLTKVESASSLKNVSHTYCRRFILHTILEDWTLSSRMLNICASIFS